MEKERGSEIRKLIKEEKIIGQVVDNLSPNAKAKYDSVTGRLGTGPDFILDTGVVSLFPKITKEGGEKKAQAICRGLTNIANDHIRFIPRYTEIDANGNSLLVPERYVINEIGKKRTADYVRELTKRYQQEKPKKGLRRLFGK